jgi:hypothetical protein
MNILELFAGSRSIGKEAEKLGMEVFSSDIEQYGGIDYVVDILQFDPSKVPFVPDVIWGSTICTGFSVAALGHHWTGGKGAFIPATDMAKLSVRLALQTIALIKYYQMLNPDLIFFIENPRGALRKMPFMQEFNRHTITYCQYGDTRMKPTDIWTNSKNWLPKPVCKNGAPCHEAAPRGSKTGTQGLKGSYERSIIPAELCREILVACYAEHRINKAA